MSGASRGSCHPLCLAGAATGVGHVPNSAGADDGGRCSARRRKTFHAGMAHAFGGLMSKTCRPHRPGGMTANAALCICQLTPAPLRGSRFRVGPGQRSHYSRRFHQCLSSSAPRPRSDLRARFGNPVAPALRRGLGPAQQAPITPFNQARGFTFSAITKDHCYLNRAQLPTPPAQAPQSGRAVQVLQREPTISSVPVATLRPLRHLDRVASGGFLIPRSPALIIVVRIRYNPYRHR